MGLCKQNMSSFREQSQHHLGILIVITLGPAVLDLSALAHEVLSQLIAALLCCLHPV